MKITFLGTGTSQGVPVIGGDASGIDLDNPKNWRTRSSVHVECGGIHIQIDAGPEFRIQCLKNKISWIDFFILTHGHADHIAGMDDLRRFCDRLPGNRLPVYSNEYGLERIRAMFPYALKEKPAERGYPCFDIKKMPDVLELPNGLKITSVALPHGPVETLGLAIEGGGKKFAYYTDCKRLTAEAFNLAKDADILALDCLRISPHPSHMSLSEALETARKVGAGATYFTHLTSHIDYGKLEPKMPPKCDIAYDGLSVEI